MVMYTRILGIKTELSTLDALLVGPNFWESVTNLWEKSPLGRTRQDRELGVRIKGYYPAINIDAFPKEWTVQEEDIYYSRLGQKLGWDESACYPYQPKLD